MATEDSTSRAANVGHHQLGRLITLADGTKAFLPFNLLTDAAGVPITDSAINAARVILYGADGHAIDTDKDHFGSLVTTDIAHSEIHERNVWEVGYHADVAASNDLDILVVTGAKEVHIVHGVASEADATFDIFENVTATAGTELTAFNCHRRAPAPSAATTFSHTPTSISNDTIQIIPQHFLLGGSGGRASGAGLVSREENVLRVNTKYIFRLNNPDGQTKRLTMQLGFYEETPPA